MISRVLFESPLLLLICWAPVQVVLLVAWSRTRTPSAAKRFWVMPALLPALLLLQAAVQTERERVIDRCHSLAHFAEIGDIPSIERALAPGFRAADWDRDSFAQRMETVLKRNRIERPSLRGFDVSPANDAQAVAEFTASAGVATSDHLSGRVSARFRLTFIKEGDDWLIESIEVVPVPTSPVRSLRDITSR
jgi:hypothetical protein